MSSLLVGGLCQAQKGGGTCAQPAEHSEMQDKKMKMLLQVYRCLALVLTLCC